MNKIYLDNAATTELDSEVLEVMVQSMKDDYGNPSSSHSFGRKSRSVIETSRRNIATFLNAHSSEIFFTSGTNSRLQVGLQETDRIQRFASHLNHL